MLAVIKTSKLGKSLRVSFNLSAAVLLLTLSQPFNAALAQNPQDIANIPVSPVPTGPMGMAPSTMRRGGPYIQEWFQRYDQVRRQSQMTPSEKQKADGLMSKGMTGLGAMLAGDEKAATQSLLNKLVGKYQAAAEQMKQLPLYPETERLHRGYYQYFSDARRLFSDYLKVQSNLFAMDEETGKPVAGLLMARKQNLETLDMNNKGLDEQLRQQFNIAPYRY
ncbi:MAG: hypothetical protein IT342_14355 [Candidatus Melainabacteria bacterium]|nr:hypothetical protein [Candidatus Melainabacteria bacterium]